MHANARPNAGRFGTKTLAIVGFTCALGIASVLTWFTFERFIRPMGWPRSEGTVTALYREPAGSDRVFQYAISFRFSIYGYQREALWRDFGSRADGERLAKMFRIGSAHKIRYNPNNFDDIRPPFVLTASAGGSVLFFAIAVVCFVMGRWFWTQPS